MKRLRGPLLPSKRALHAPWFLSGAVGWLCLAGWWWARGAQGPLHGLLFTLGFMPSFIAGFALQALPKWLGQAPLRRLSGWGPWLLMQAAWLLSLHAGRAHWLLPLAWAWLLVPLWRCWLLSAKPDRRHATLVLLGMSHLAVALLSWSLGAERLAAGLGLWGGLATVFAAALQRLTPFLHAEGRRSDLLLAALLAGLWLRGLELLPHSAAMMLDLVVALLLGLAAFRPELAAARRTGFVRQLHHGLLWLLLSFVLAALGLTLAALHALTLGFMGSTWLAMVSRVSVVQAGGVQVVDRGLWTLHLLLQLSCALRVIAACWSGPAPWLLPASALAFACCALGWLLRYGPMLGRAMARPG